MIEAKDSPQLLVSVTSAEEARIAVEAGADLIDIKNPKRGPMGMADRAIIDAIIVAVQGARPVSVALGELREHTGIVSLPKDVSFAKVALAGMAQVSDWQQRLTAVLAPLMVGGDDHPRAVAVAYADAPQAEAPPVDDVLAWVLKSPAAGLLIDTAVKDGKGLFDHMSPAQLTAMQTQLNAAGKILALAGGLSSNAFEQAANLRPSIVGVRGAACVGHDRTGTIDAQAVAALVDTVAVARAKPIATIAQA